MKKNNTLNIIEKGAFSLFFITYFITWFTPALLLLALIDELELALIDHYTLIQYFVSILPYFFDLALSILSVFFPIKIYKKVKNKTLFWMLYTAITLLLFYLIMKYIWGALVNVGPV